LRPESTTSITNIARSIEFGAGASTLEIDFRGNLQFVLSCLFGSQPSSLSNAPFRSKKILIDTVPREEALNYWEDAKPATLALRAALRQKNMMSSRPEFMPFKTGEGSAVAIDGRLYGAHCGVSVPSFLIEDLCRFIRVT
jgi:hypothetical protein